uniref:Uncharacterized protein n=1 Tax=Bionectria ochroleuca TaxID=29856 RepID=A0A8H7MYU7_BIOOC
MKHGSTIRLSLFSSLSTPSHTACFSPNQVQVRFAQANPVYSAGQRGAERNLLFPLPLPMPRSVWLHLLLQVAPAKRIEVTRGKEGAFCGSGEVITSVWWMGSS